MRPESASHPARIGRYEIVGEVGRGTMGIVYEARDPVLERTVALKTIDTVMAAALGAPTEFERRFFREAEIAARLSHPGIVACHDVGKDADTGTLFMVLEYLPGRTLSANLKSHGAMPWYQAVPILAVVARAVHHAHAQGVVHRDLKPGNIMLLDSGDPKIMDFGIAKASTSGVNVTAAGQFLGSPLYSSPEQALGRPVDARSDIFSLGTILCSLLEGRHHFAASAIPEIAARIIREDPPRLSQLVPGVPPALDEVMARAMAKTPADRYSTAEAMADDLEDVLASRPPRHAAGDAPAVGEGTAPPIGAAAPASATAPATGRVGARWLVAIAALALGGVLVTGLGVLALVLPRIRSTPEAVTRSAEVPAPSAPAPERPASSPEPTATPAEAAPQPAAAEQAATKPPTTEAVGTDVAVQPPERAEPVRRVAAVAKTPLHLVIEHTLKNGRLRLWIDQSLAYETKLEAAVSKKIVAIKIRDARLEHTLDVEPGRHEIRVAVDWDDNQRMESTLADIRSEPRELSVKLGRLRKKLSLEWHEAADRTSAAAGRPD